MSQRPGRIAGWQSNRVRTVAALAAVTSGTFAGLVATAGAAPVADGRTAELVSQNLQFGRGVTSAPPILDPAGERLVFEIDAAQADSGGAREATYRTAGRSAGGWTSADATPPSTSLQTSFSRIAAVSPDAESYIIRGPAIEPSSTASIGLFSVATATRTATLLGDRGDVFYAGASRSRDVVYTAAFTPLAPGAEAYPGESEKIYRHQDGVVRLVSRLPPEVVAEPGYQVADLDESVLGSLGLSPDLSPTGIQLGFVRLPVAGGRRQVVSDDGDHTYFLAGTQPSDTPLNSFPLLPLWSGDGLGDATPISVSRRPGETGELRAARFVGASADGDTVFFFAGVPLQATELGGGLYRYVRSTDELTRLTPGIQPGSDELEGFRTLGVSSAWASADARTVYFVATAALAPGATAGSRNAYAWRAGELRFVGALSSQGTVQRASANGEYAVFESSTKLDGSQSEFSQVYRYDYRADEMRCASCRADGSENAGRSAVTIQPDEPTSAELNSPAQNSPRGVTDDGSVFFTSEDTLVAGDARDPRPDTPTAPFSRPDVYEFTDAGVRLLTAGESTSSSYLSDNTDDGRSVFIVSTSRLTPEDEDGGDFDLFVRREGGGFPPPAVQPAPCSGDGCQAPAAGSFALPTPRSDLPGAGNVRPALRARLLSRPRISPAGRRALARGRQATVAVRLSGPGRLTVRLRARAGNRTRAVAATSALVRSASVQTKTATVRLSRAGRQLLRRRGTVRLTISTSLTGAGTRTAVTTIRRER